MIILAAPPAAAITYVNESRGLEPSVYGGGGSASSALLLDSPLLSAGRAALVSASTVLVVSVRAACAGCTRQNAGGGPLSGSVTDAFRRSGDVCGGKYREEKGGGAKEGNVDEDAGGSGCSGDSVYGGSASQGFIDARKDTLSDTDEPSLESRVADNLMVVCCFFKGSLRCESGRQLLRSKQNSKEVIWCTVESS